MPELFEKKKPRISCQMHRQVTYHKYVIPKLLEILLSNYKYLLNYTQKPTFKDNNIKDILFSSNIFLLQS